MYEDFRNEFITKICDHIETKTLQYVCSILDEVAIYYDINRTETAIATTDDFTSELRYMWSCSKQVEGRSKEYIRNSNYYLSYFFQYVTKPIDKITANDIRVFLERWQVERNITNRTKDKLRATILHFFTWLTEEGYIQTNPASTIKPVKCMVKPREALSDLETEQLRRCCKNVRESAIIETFLSTGCRVSELANAKITDINFTDGSMLVLGKGNKKRFVYFSPKAVVALEDYFKTRNDSCPYLIKSLKGNKGVGKAGLEKIVRDISSRTQKMISPHILRHTFATSAVTHGMPITDAKELLGHASVNTTMIYLTMNDTEIKASHRKFVV